MLRVLVSGKRRLSFFHRLPNSLTDVRRGDFSMSEGRTPDEEKRESLLRGLSLPAS